MIRIILDNMIIIITNKCPSEFAACAVRSLDRRTPNRVEVDDADDFVMPIPRFSSFIGQLGAKTR